MDETAQTESTEIAGASSAIPGSTAVLNLQPECKLVCVEYPGFVTNVDKMLETVGGEKGVSKTYADPAKRLELNYRPRDPYCHPLCGNRFPSTSLLLRVRRRTRKGSDAETQIDMEIAGHIGTTYKFQGMGDFQYLAVHTEEDGSQTSLYDKILLQKPENKEFFDKDMPLYIPPPIFSRLDNPVDYYYRPEIQHREGYASPVVSSEKLIGLSRARRPHNAIFINFDDKEVPKEPLEAAVRNWKRVCMHESDSKAEEDMRQMFERRPIWSRNAVKANLDLHPEKLKLLLPYMAYYMLTGPWRSLWVRFDYDPRKMPEAKAYQVLDFRIRCGMKHGYTPNELPVKAKRSTYNYSLPTTINKAAPQAASVREITQEGIHSTGRKPAPPRYQLKESAYIFREGMLPPYRQMFYQLCDLEVDGTADELRDIMCSLIKQKIRSARPALFSAKPKRGAVRGRGAPDQEEEEEDEEDEEEEDEDEEEFQPSEGSDNEMETEILDYM